MTRIFGILIAVLVTFALMTASGATQDKRERDKKGALPPYWDQLGLSKDQEEKIKTIRAGVEAKIRALREQELTDMRAVLSADQKANLAKLLLAPKQDKEGK